MKMSANIIALAKALIAVQAELKSVGKDADNTFFKSHYTTFAALTEALREPFAKHGLAFLQPTSIGSDGALIVETVIIHISGEWISGEITGKPVKNDPQGVGSLMSYLRRYGLQSMIGLASKDDDDDGNAASGKYPGQEPKPRGRPPLHKESKPPPGHDVETMPFGMHDEIYSEMPHQKDMLARDAKKLGITDIPSLRHLSMTCKEHRVFVSDLPMAIQEWISDGKKVQHESRKN